MNWRSGDADGATGKEEKMANTITNYTDSEIMKALITHNFNDIGGEFEDDVITTVKAGAFYQAQNLTKVSLPSVTKVCHYAFTETSLSTLELTWAALTSIGCQAFYKGWAALPAALTLSNLTELGAGAFAGTSSAKNTKVTSVSLPRWTGAAPASNGMASTGVGTFEYCSALASVNAPELATLTNYMFRYCTALEEIVLPKARTMASNLFTGCTKLKKVDLGGEISSISSAFLPTGTNVFEALILRGVTTVPTLGSSTFNSTKIASGAAYVYVPQSLEALFKVASNWSKYSAQIRAIEDYPDVCGS